VVTGPGWRVSKIQGQQCRQLVLGNQPRLHRAISNTDVTLRYQLALHSDAVPPLCRPHELWLRRNCCHNFRGGDARSELAGVHY